ncbi:MAG: hypothetical protein C5B45_06810 [Chlamydiae bacterium]|nr:MAG: hypothetical protein C5B45_06810 [Chlamydiota bacterium]
MTHELRPLNTRIVTVPIPHKTPPIAIRKITIIATKIISLLTAGMGIGYLIAIKTAQNSSCSKNPPPINPEEDAFWNGCCRPLFKFIGCLKETIPNFSYFLNQCPTSDCDP